MSLAHIKQPDPQKLASGEEHGLLKVNANSVPFSEYKRFKEKDRAAMEKLHKEQSKMIKCQYINKKGKNERLEITHCDWDGDPLLSYKFVPDQEYEIPKGLIDKVNKKKKQKRSDLLGRDGKPLMQDSQETGDDLFIPLVAGF